MRLELQFGQGSIARSVAARSPAEGERVDGRPQDAQNFAQDNQVEGSRLAPGCQGLLAPCGLHNGNGARRLLGGFRWLLL